MKSIYIKYAIFIPIALVLQCITLYSQNNFLLKTQDLEGPLPGVFITLNTIEGKVLQHTSSNTDGLAEFELADSTSHFRILAQLFGYVKVDTLVDQMYVDTNGLILTLTPKVVELNQAIVTAKKSARLVNNNDTSSIDITSLGDSTASSISELLSRSPDILIDSRGTIEYRGKAVNRVFIDGKDVFGSGQYQDPLKSLDADLIEKVDAIERFHEDHVLARLEPSQETILNLTTKAEAKGKVNGRINVEEGANTNLSHRYSYRGNGLLLGGKTLAYSKIETSRLGDQILDPSQQRIYGAEKQQEPIGVLQFEEPIASSTWQATRSDVPTQLLNDAKLSSGNLSIFRNGKKFAKTRLQLIGTSSSDFLSRNVSVESLGENLAFRFDSDQNDRYSNNYTNLNLEHYNASPNGKTSLKATASTTISTSLLDQLLKSYPTESFSSVNDLNSITLSAGSRVNRSLGESSAIQLYGEFSNGNFQEIFTTDLDSVLNSTYLAGIPATSSVKQSRKIEHNELRTGINLFARNNFGLLTVKLETQQLNFNTKQSWTTGLPTIDSFSNIQSYSIYRAELGENFSLSPNWTASANANFLAVGNKNSTTLEAQPGYYVKLESIKPRLGNIELYARRILRDPLYPNQPETTFFQGPFSAELSSLNLRPTVKDQVGFTFARGFQKLDLDLRAIASYSWRTQELSGSYLFNDQTVTSNTAAQRRGSGANANLYLSNTNIKLRTVTQVKAFMNYQNQNSTILSLDGQIKTFRFGYEIKLTLPRIYETHLQLHSSNTSAITSGRINAQNVQNEFGFTAKYFASPKLTTIVKSAVGRGRSGSISAQTFSYLELEINYVFLKNIEDIEIGLHVFNLLTGNNIRSFTYSDPFTFNESIDILPTTFILKATLPFNTNIK